MNKFTSHFRYSKSQRNGVFLLIAAIVVVQCVYFLIDFSNSEKVKSSEELAIRKKIDSLHQLKEEKPKAKIFQFNPNFITDYKGYTLGMSIDEIDRLHQFRARGKYVNSVREFQQVTQVSDSLLRKISPYFKFPDWVNKRTTNQKKYQYYTPDKAKDISEIKTNDLNHATISDFTIIKNVDEALAARIVRYREKLQGYSYQNQLNEVWGITSNQVKQILKIFSITKKPEIVRVNINTATFKEVLATPYVDYELCKKIFQYRDEVAELQTIEELKNIEGFPLNKYDRIVLYLSVK